MFLDRADEALPLRTAKTVVCACAVLFALSCALATDEAVKVKGRSNSEYNSELSRLLSRLVLVDAAGATSGTGSFKVKVFAVPKGEECDVPTSLCEGVELVISVSSLDLFGDHALHRISGLSDWKFLKWNEYAKYDAPEYFTSFDISGQWKNDRPELECRNEPHGAGTEIRIYVNPWKTSCEYLDSPKPGSR